MNLLLSPYKLSTDLLCIELLHIARDSKGISITTSDPVASQLRDHCPTLSKTSREALSFFTRQKLLEARQAFRRIIDEQSPDAADKLRAALLRKAYDNLLAFKPSFTQVKWHHKTKQENGHFKTASCLLRTERPQLSFTIIRKGEGFTIECFIETENGKTLLSDFVRHAFLIERQGEYHLLNWKDYQTLEWLSRLSLPAEAGIFRTDIVARLMSDYTIEGKSALDSGTIEVLPQPRIYLSEISGSFLVLTPQWSYDGFIQEGPWKEETEVQDRGHLYVLRRNKEAEDSLREQLEALHPNFSKQLNGYYYLSFGDAQKKQWFAKTYHKLLDSGIEIIGMDMLKHFRFTPEKIATELTITEQNERGFLLSLRVSFGKEEIPVNELQKILWAGQKAVLLKDNSLGLITDEWLARYGTLVKHARIEKKLLRVGRWFAFDSDLQGDSSLMRKEWWDKWNQYWKNEGPVYPLPAGLEVAQLRPYQQRGYDWLRLLAEAGAGACLADDMGLGKTLQTICLLVARIEENVAAPSLVVAPSSLLYNWQQELSRFAPSLRVYVHHGAERKAEALNGDAQIIITSYGTLRSDLYHFTALHYDCIVADESHTIKNPASQTARAIAELNAAFRIALSGTPVMNNTFDLYGQFNFLVPGMFSSREFFKREYADPIDRDHDPEKIKSLQRLTAPFLLRRTKEQVAPDLPEKTESILWCEMEGEQRLAYESVRDNIRSNLFTQISEKGLAAGKLSVLHGITKLRQLCNSGELVKDEDIFTYESVKTKVLLEELKNITLTGKALVFSQFTSMLDLLERDLTAARLPFLRLDGSTPAEKRQQLVNEFNNDDTSPKIFLLSLKAGNAGLNLTAADYVFLFDPWWNRAVEQQAIDRTHRIGQTKSIFAYRMLCRDSIEEKMLTLQQRKSQLSEDLIGDESSLVQALTEDDLAFLFS